MSLFSGGGVQILLHIEPHPERPCQLQGTTGRSKDSQRLLSRGQLTRVYCWLTAHAYVAAASSPLRIPTALEGSGVRRSLRDGFQGPMEGLGVGLAPEPPVRGRCLPQASDRARGSTMDMPVSTVDVLGATQIVTLGTLGASTLVCRSR